MRGRRQHGDHDVAALGDGGGRDAGGGTEPDRGLERGGHRVVGHDGEALLDQVSEHGEPHGSGADESDVHTRVSFSRRGGLSSRSVSAPSSPEALRGLALIALAAIAWGTTGAVTTVLVTRAGATPLVIGAVRMVIAAALLAGAARLLTGPRVAAASPADRWRCVAAGVCNAGFQAAYFTSVTLTGIAIAALIAICSAPILIAGLAVVLLKERLSARLVVALALGVGGTTLLVVAPRAAGAAPPH